MCLSVDFGCSRTANKLRPVPLDQQIRRTCSSCTDQNDTIIHTHFHGCHVMLRMHWLWSHANKARSAEEVIVLILQLMRRMQKQPLRASERR